MGRPMEAGNSQSSSLSLPLDALSDLSHQSDSSHSGESTTEVLVGLV